MRRATVLLGIMVLVAVVVVLLGWRGAQSPGEPGGMDGAGPTPSETRAGRALLQARHPARVPALDEVAGPFEMVVVQPGSWHALSVYDGRVSSQRAYSTRPVRPAATWPTRDEAPWPDHPLTEGLLGAEPHDVDLHALAAEVDGTDDPWLALLALEATLRAATDTADEARRAWDAEHLPAPLGEEGARAFAQAMGDALPPRPTSPLAPLIERARRLQERFPDHPTAEHARLYILYALQDPGADSVDPQALAEEALATLRDSHDEVVVDQAATLLAHTPDARLDAEDLSMLASVVDDPDAEVPRHELAAIGLNAALDDDELGAAAAWAERQRDALWEVCEVDDAHALEVCDIHRRGLDRVEAYLTARGAGDAVPATWKGALELLVLRCADVGAPLDTQVQARGTWQDGWTWSAWTSTGPLTTCIERAGNPSPPPPDGQRVALWVVPAAGAP